MDTKRESQHHVVVVGGGPAGATTATLVARQGYRVLLLEKERFPRYQIGESLLPSTVHGVCRILGVADEVAAAGFPVKRGGTFRWGRNPSPWTFEFAGSKRLSGSGTTAYQVERMKFDQILLDQARRSGVEVKEECTVTGVLEDDGRVRGVTYRDPDRGECVAAGEYVVDCSGNQSRIFTRVGERRYSDFFRNIAVFGYFSGGKRLAPPFSGNILCAAFDEGWFWYIPLSDSLTSVGAVVHPDSWKGNARPKPEFLQSLIERCTLVSDFLADATRVTSGPYGEVRIRKDYSYCNEAFWRPGLVLAGDAACFIDPVFSSGVHLATYSGLLAARSVNTALRGTVPEETCFEEYETRYRAEYRIFHDFLMAFYDANQDEDSYFWRAKRLLNGDGAAQESFVDLVGGGASEEAVLTGAVPGRGDLEPARREFSTIVNGPDSGESLRLHQSALVKPLLTTAMQLQSQGVSGRNLADRRSVTGRGLVTSSDGLHWERAGAR